MQEAEAAGGGGQEYCIARVVVPNQGIWDVSRVGGESVELESGEYLLCHAIDEAQRCITEARLDAHHLPVIADRYRLSHHAGDGMDQSRIEVDLVDTRCR